MHDLDVGHEHSPGYDPDDSRDFTWLRETIELFTVGIDIGSATSHVTFARIHLQRVGQLLSDRFVTVRRDFLYESEILLTPYLSDEEIDAEAIRAFVDRCYLESGWDHTTVDTGAVLLTGTALLRKNAESLSRELAAVAGDFVCVAASHHLEALLAAGGSGAVAESHGRPGLVLSLDIGGGTTKFTWLRDGDVVGTAAIAVGGRQVVWDADGRVIRLEGYAQQMSDHIGLELSLGRELKAEGRSSLVTPMADLVARAVAGERIPEELREHFELTPWPDGVAELPDLVVVSGGVSEFFGSDPAEPVSDLNDLGAALGRAVEARLIELGVTYESPPNAIRATVLGAAGYSVNVSGNTVYVSRPDIVPIREIPVAAVSVSADDTVEHIAKGVSDAVQRRLSPDRRGLCLFLETDDQWLEYRELRRLADGIAEGWKLLGDQRPAILLVALSTDIAQGLGHLMTEDVGFTDDLMCIDGLELGEFDYIDVGPLSVNVYPVMIKSLIFGEA